MPATGNLYTLFGKILILSDIAYVKQTIFMTKIHRDLGNLHLEMVVKLTSVCLEQPSTVATTKYKPPANNTLWNVGPNLGLIVTK